MTPRRPRQQFRNMRCTACTAGDCENCTDVRRAFLGLPMRCPCARPGHRGEFPNASEPHPERCGVHDEPIGASGCARCLSAELANTGRFTTEHDGVTMDVEVTEEFPDERTEEIHDWQAELLREITENEEGDD
jgi:hypothetical protein